MWNVRIVSCTGLADRLRRDDTDSLADVHHVTGRQVAVAQGADAAAGLAREHAVDLHVVDARVVDLGAEGAEDLIATLAFLQRELFAEPALPSRLFEAMGDCRCAIAEGRSWLELPGR